MKGVATAVIVSLALGVFIIVGIGYLVYSNMGRFSGITDEITSKEHLKELDPFNFPTTKPTGAPIKVSMGIESLSAGTP